MKRCLWCSIVGLCLIIFTSCGSSNIVLESLNSSLYKWYYNDKLCVYQEQDGIVVGLTNVYAKDDYGKYYQLDISVLNNTGTFITIYPEAVSAYLKNGETIKELKVYTHDSYMKMVRKKQNIAMALYGFSAGFNAGMAGYTTSYAYNSRTGYTYPVTTYNPSVAFAANTQATMQILAMSKMMNDERKMLNVGYIKKNTIRNEEAISGYINIKYEKGESMTINIPIEGRIFKFDWSINNVK
ncbi:MAG: hypothetical protein IKL35_05305 [Muribaculaceae bacterium]|nr:hypothetical protein [Muribaculaceae bacterium]